MNTFIQQESIQLVNSYVTILSFTGFFSY